MVRWKYAQCIVVVILFSGFFFGRISAAPQAASQREIRFIVAGSDNSKPLPGVEIILLSSGKRVLGRTDSLGSFVIKAFTIQKSNAHAVLFCTEHYFCGAIPVDPELFEYSEKYIELAPFAVR